MRGAIIKLIALPMALAILFPALGWAAACEAGTQAVGQSMACCRAMGNRCMHTGERSSPQRGSDCCHRHASAPTPVALVGGQNSIQPGAPNSIVSATATSAAILAPEWRVEVRPDELSPPRKSPPFQLHPVLLI